ncbi:RelA/SpoT family protein [Paracoccaceae bacterium GXU_MW_L88]
MIPVDTLVGTVQSYNPASNTARIRKAYEFGREAHRGQYRKSGEEYFTHPVEVAMLLAEQQLDDDTIITALLHDTVEDTEATRADLGDLFGENVADLVDGVTKLTNLELSSAATQQAENFRKLLMAMSKDLRVILVKLADRLHNMRTIESLPEAKRMRKARETMEIYAPLAGRMGMMWMREELEDLSFAVLNPAARESIMNRIERVRGEAGDLIPAIMDDMRRLLVENGVAAEVTGREKRPYSIWRKMEERKEGFSRLSDIYGFRIVTDTVEDCYKILGLVHGRWAAVPGRFKDYISQPKSNGYRSIHTTVSGRAAKRVEVQIRTRQMHQVNESGVAAHWSYRDGVQAENPFTVDPLTWLQNLTERFAGAEHPEEFLEHVKLEMFSDKVFCFTPKGEVIKLPKGATPLDFAYAIHTRIGNSCVGAKVDGQRVPLWTQLRNGQSVVIIRAEGQKPQPGWEEMVVTGRAKAAIRRALKEERRGTNIALGREVARVALERVGKKASDKALRTAAKRANYEDAQDMLAALGAGEIAGRDLVGVLYPEILREENIPQFPAAPVIVGVEEDQWTKMSPCCYPLPGERIIGISQRGHGVHVHTIDCPRLTEYEDAPQRWVDLKWSGVPYKPEHKIRISLAMANDAGVLGRICTLIGEQNANISDLEFTDRKPDFYRMNFEIEVRDLEHYHNVRTALEADSDVAEVVRQRGSAQR